MYVLWFSFHSVQTPRSDGESLEDPEMKKGHVPQLPGLSQNFVPFINIISLC